MSRTETLQVEMEDLLSKLMSGIDPEELLENLDRVEALMDDLGLAKNEPAPIQAAPAEYKFRPGIRPDETVLPRRALEATCASCFLIVSASTLVDGCCEGCR